MWVFGSKVGIGFFNHIFSSESVAALGLNVDMTTLRRGSQENKLRAMNEEW